MALLLSLALGHRAFPDEAAPPSEGSSRRPLPAFAGDVPHVWNEPVDDSVVSPGARRHAVLRPESSEPLLVVSPKLIAKTPFEATAQAGQLLFGLSTGALLVATLTLWVPGVVLTAIGVLLFATVVGAPLGLLALVTGVPLLLPVVPVVGPVALALWNPRFLGGTPLLGPTSRDVALGQGLLVSVGVAQAGGLALLLFAQHHAALFKRDPSNGSSGPKNPFLLPSGPGATPGATFGFEF